MPATTAKPASGSFISLGPKVIEIDDTGFGPTTVVYAVNVFSSISATQAGQVAAGVAGVILGPVGVASGVQAGQAVFAVGSTRLNGTVAAVQPGQTATMAMPANLVASIGGTQAGQVAAGAGSSRLDGAASTGQTGQTAAGTGSMRLNGTVAAAQGDQFAEGAGSVGGTIPDPGAGFGNLIDRDGSYLVDRNGDYLFGRV